MKYRNQNSFNLKETHLWNIQENASFNGTGKVDFGSNPAKIFQTSGRTKQNRIVARYRYCPFSYPVQVVGQGKRWNWNPHLNLVLKHQQKLSFRFWIYVFYLITPFWFRPQKLALEESLKFHFKYTKVLESTVCHKI